MRKYMTDAPSNKISTALRSKVSTLDSGLARKTSVRDNMARTTRISTFYGAKYSASRDGDSLNIHEEGGEGISQRKLVACFWGKAFFAEIESDELSICLVSDDVVATTTLGDRVDTKMTAAKFQQKIIGKVRRACGGLR
jgi:hypothetical protein